MALIMMHSSEGWYSKRFTFMIAFETAVIFVALILSVVLSLLVRCSGDEYPPNFLDETLE